MAENHKRVAVPDADDVDAVLRPALPDVFATRSALRTQNASAPTAPAPSQSTSPARSSSAPSSFTGAFGYVTDTEAFRQARQVLDAAAAQHEAQEEAQRRVAATSTVKILVSGRQRGNPVLKHIRSVGWEYRDIEPDYILGASVCALFLSLKYHRMHPQYIRYRLRHVGGSYRTRIVLCQRDATSAEHLEEELNKLCLESNTTLVMCWSEREVARYLESFKAFENKPADLISQRVGEDYMSQLTDILTSIPFVNKTDVLTLVATFGSFQAIATASREQLAACPGIGQRKIDQIYAAFHDRLDSS